QDGRRHAASSYSTSESFRQPVRGTSGMSSSRFEIHLALDSKSAGRRCLSDGGTEGTATSRPIPTDPGGHQPPRISVQRKDASSGPSAASGGPRVQYCPMAQSSTELHSSSVVPHARAQAP